MKFVIDNDVISRYENNIKKAKNNVSNKICQIV